MQNANIEQRIRGKLQNASYEEFPNTVVDVWVALSSRIAPHMLEPQQERRYPDKQRAVDWRYFLQDIFCCCGVRRIHAKKVMQNTALFENLVTSFLPRLSALAFPGPLKTSVARTLIHSKKHCAKPIPHMYTLSALGAKIALDVFLCLNTMLSMSCQALGVQSRTTIVEL